jgi:hypothetical protein
VLFRSILPQVEKQLGVIDDYSQRELEME